MTEILKQIPMAGTAVILSTVMVIYPSLAQPDSLITESEITEIDTDSRLILFLEDLLPESASLIWQEMTVPYGKTHLRLRTQDPITEPNPSHILRGLHQGDSWTAGILIARDEGEPDVADLFRLTAKWQINRRTRLIAGDFRVDEGMGWTVGTVPTWNSSSDPLAGLRFNAHGPRINLSSEEGWGWRGGAASFLSNKDSPASFQMNRTSIWAGIVDLDARPDDNGMPILYSTQGDHSGNRDEMLLSVRNFHAGAKTGMALPGPLGHVNVIGSLDRFDEELSPEITVSRFAGIDSDFHAYGIHWRNSNRSGRVSAEAEATRQSTGGIGGGASIGVVPAKDQQLVLSGWRATTSFATLHARPYLGFGSTPDGWTGARLAWRVKHAVIDMFAFMVTAGNKEEFDGDTGDSRRRYDLLAELQLSDDLLILQTAGMQQYQSENFRPSWRTRTLVRHRQPAGRLDLRLENAWNDNGWIGAATVGLVQKPNRLLRIAMTVTGITGAQQGGVVTIIEPAGPGQFPIRRVGSRQLRAAVRIDLFPFENTILWISAASNHSLETADNEGADHRFAAGLEWQLDRQPRVSADKPD